MVLSNLPVWLHCTLLLGLWMSQMHSHGSFPSWGPSSVADPKFHRIFQRGVSIRLRTCLWGFCRRTLRNHCRESEDHTNLGVARHTFVVLWKFSFCKVSKLNEYGSNCKWGCVWFIEGDIKIAARQCLEVLWWRSDFCDFLQTICVWKLWFFRLGCRLIACGGS